MATSPLDWVTAQQLSDTIRVPVDNFRVTQAVGAANELVASLVRENATLNSERQKQAALMGAVEIYQAVTAAGGEMVMSDMTIMPSRMGPALPTRLMGLLADDVPLECG
jgi:hypothetical protein